MKLLIILAAVALGDAAKLDRTYLPPNAQQSSGSAFLQTPRESRFQAQPIAYSADAFLQNNDNINAYNNFARQERPQAAYERNAAILRLDNDNDGERYAYAYETENGIYAEENGVATNGVQAQGGFTYTGDDGKVYSIRYTADENGFVPQGDYLPTPPPVPEEILKSLEQNARDEAAGIYDDGSYTDAKYVDNVQRYNSNAQPINYNAAPINVQGDAIITNAAISRTSENARALSIGSPEKAYLPPSAQRATNNLQDDAIITNAAISRTSANARALSTGNPEKAYLPPFAQRTFSNAQDTIVTNAAIFRTSGNARALSAGNPENAYLPPFSQRVSNQRTASARQFSFNTRDGYRY